jgi:flagellar protein FlbT
MSILILELKQGETLLVNGAVIRFKTRARIELSTQARFMFGKQIMPSEEAVTPGRRIYYDLQTAYVGPEEDRAPAFSRALSRITALAEAGPPDLRELLAPLLAAIESGAFFDALKRARQIIRMEEAAEAMAERGELTVASGQGST